MDKPGSGSFRFQMIKLSETNYALYQVWVSDTGVIHIVANSPIIADTSEHALQVRLDKLQAGLDHGSVDASCVVGLKGDLPTNS